ncbi:MAG: hypothetical protein Tsb0020_31660 [Haliangiales bacterium]
MSRLLDKRAESAGKPEMHSDELSAIDTQTMPSRVVRDSFVAISPREAVEELESEVSGPTGVPDFQELPTVMPEAYVRGPELARGGMGRVWAARDRRIGRSVVLKESFADSNELADRRLEREARITGRLQHPSVVPIYEAGRWPNGKPFYAMKLVAGESLAKLLARSTSLDQRLPLLPHVIATAEALAYAHSHGIVHRDLKPANVIIGEFGETIVIDWGLAQDMNEVAALFSGSPEGAAQSDTASASSSGGPGTDEVALASLGRAVGTPAFMPPEQAEGLPVDPRADVYSLGAILYNLLCGQRPYANIGSGRQVLDMVTRQPPRALVELAPEAPDDLVTIVDKAMSRNPARRYPSARELAADLLRFQAGKLVSSHHYSLWSLARRFVRTHRTAVAVAISAAVLLGALAVVGVKRVIAERNQAESARAVAETARNQALAATAAIAASHNQLLLLQAINALTHDPTATVAWLKEVPLNQDNVARARSLFGAALARGVAVHVIPYRNIPLAVTFSPDGTQLAVTTLAGTLELIDVGSGQRQQLEHASPILHALAFSSDGRRLAAAGATGRIHLWSLRGGEPGAPPTPLPLRLSGLDGLIYQLDFLARDRYLAGRDSRGRFAIWDLERGADRPLISDIGPVVFAARSETLRYAVYQPAQGRLRVLTAAPGASGETAAAPRERASVAVPPLRSQLAISPDGQRLAAIGRELNVYLIDLDSGAIITLGQLSTAHSQTPLELSPGGRWLATLDDAQTIRLWDLDTRSSRLLSGHQGEIGELSFSPDERHLMSASDDRTARLWNLETDQVSVLDGHDDDVTHSRVSPLGDTLATASLDQSVRIWPLVRGDGEQLGGHRSGAVAALGFVSDLGLISATAKGEIRHWQLAAGRNTQLRPPADDNHVGYDFQSSDGQVIALFNPSAERLTLWDASTRSERLLSSDLPDVSHVSISRDHGWVAASSGDTITIWSRGTGRQTSTVYPEAVCELAFTADGSELAIVGVSDVTRWDTARQTVVGTVKRPSGGHTCAHDVRGSVRYSPDGRWLAVSGLSAGIELWDRQTDTMWRPYEITERALEVAFSPAGDTLAIATNQHHVYAWPITREAEFQSDAPLGRHDDLIITMAFSPDGDRLITAGQDRVIHLWELKNGQHRELQGHSDTITKVAFAPDGTFIVSASTDGSIRKWEPDRSAKLNATTLGVHFELATSALLDDHNRPRTPSAPSEASGAAPSDPVPAPQPATR